MMPKPVQDLGNTVFFEDGLTGMERLGDESVDMVLCDLPYGTTQCRWDSPLAFPDLWQAWLRVAKPHAAIVLTASQPFTRVADALPGFRVRRGR